MRLLCDLFRVFLSPSCLNSFNIVVSDGPAREPILNFCFKLSYGVANVFCRKVIGEQFKTIRGVKFVPAICVFRYRPKTVFTRHLT
mmetsp:Transcript_46666/g.105865  ORF Transcript_46666/g.105865 Transcript_46666/m.105865 type:complete len:86 (+) Transcript_46666:236-493(+)